MAIGQIIGQRIKGKKPRFGDFTIRQARAQIPKVPDDIKANMVTLAGMGVQKQAMPLRLRGHFKRCLFSQFTP
jgi:hypothetical protein